MNLTGTRSQWRGWSSFIVRPSVALAIPWVGVSALWVITKIPVVRWPSGPDEVVRLVSPTLFGWATVVNAVLLVALLVEGKLALSSPRDLKRAHLVTVVLAMALLVMLQLGAFLAVSGISA